MEPGKEGRVIVLTMIPKRGGNGQRPPCTHESGSWKLPGGFSVNWKGSSIRVIVVTNYLKWEGTGWQATTCDMSVGQSRNRADHGFKTGHENWACGSLPSIRVIVLTNDLKWEGTMTGFWSCERSW